MATLCDAVSVREQLLHVLGAGVSTTMHPSYPAPLSVNVALMLEFDEVAESGEEHDLKIEVLGGAGRDESPDVLASLEARFSVRRVDKPGREGLPFNMPIPVHLQDVALPAEGRYRVLIGVDGAEMAVLHLAALKGEPPSAL